MSKKPQKKSPKSAGGRGRYTPEFRQEALLLAVRVGVADAAEQLGVAPGLLYTWQGKARQASQGAKVEQAQAAEIARLKRQLAEQTEELAIIKKAAAYFARTSK
ncbi:MAG: transposase [Pseudomonadota bacterium]